MNDKTARRNILPYNPHLKELARNLRKNSTLSEVLLWKQLKNRGIRGMDFDRQKPIGDYIVDFFCKELMLAIEIDGESHYGKRETDVRRQKALEELGISFLRFSDKDIKTNLTEVVSAIERWMDEHRNETEITHPGTERHPSKAHHYPQIRKR